MKKKGYAAGGALPMKKNPAGEMVPAYAMDGKGKMNKGGMAKKKGMAKGGAMMKKKGYAKGGMKKKGYAAGGKVMTYNVGGMVKSSGTLNTGIKKA